MKERFLTSFLAAAQNEERERERMEKKGERRERKMRKKNENDKKKWQKKKTIWLKLNKQNVFLAIADGCLWLKKLFPSLEEGEVEVRPIAGTRPLNKAKQMRAGRDPWSLSYEPAYIVLYNYKGSAQIFNSL